MRPFWFTERYKRFTASDQGFLCDHFGLPSGINGLPLETARIQIQIKMAYTNGFQQLTAIFFIFTVVV
jgi:hypothetical protein